MSTPSSSQLFSSTYAPRRPTYPMANTARRKPRRLPLVLRFAKGAIHNVILVPVLLHSLFTSLIVYLDRFVTGTISIPSTIIPSLSIVVGLILVFRNSTSYDRFWTGRNCLTTVGSCIRGIARVVLVNARTTPSDSTTNDDADAKKQEEERRDTESAIRALVAMLYAIKNNLRQEFNLPAASLASLSQDRQFQQTYRDNTGMARSRATSRRPSIEGGWATPKDEYDGLLPDGLSGYEDRGLSLPLQLANRIEAYISRHSSPSPQYPKPYFHAPLSASLSTQLSALITAYGQMETIRSTPLPIAHQIHARQVLALYTCVLPFAIVDDYGWWAIPVVALVAFTLYGIEGIGLQLEDPFGYDKNDIKMDGIVEDARVEVMVMLEDWRAREDGERGVFD